MRVTTVFRFAAIAAIVGLSALGAAAQDQGSDDVAAAARKAREQAKNAPAPKKVITNDDIPAPKTAGPAADANGTKPAEGVPGAADDKSADNDPKSEAYWRKKFGTARDKLATAEKELDVMQRELDKDQVQYYTDPQKALMQQHDRTDINDKTAKIDEKKKEIESLKQQLTDMEDDLRKAGGDPGWAR